MGSRRDRRPELRPRPAQTAASSPPRPRPPNTKNAWRPSRTTSTGSGRSSARRKRGEDGPLPTRPDRGQQETPAE
ncbi:MAG: hypothetical protein M0C28_32105 [Candidatus Moduliflexus flocculans]|nr:hypothetical protein [Candidatus Moduliflexus flocculans]